MVLMKCGYVVIFCERHNVLHNSCWMNLEGPIWQRRIVLYPSLCSVIQRSERVYTSWRRAKKKRANKNVPANAFGEGP